MYPVLGPLDIWQILQCSLQKLLQIVRRKNTFHDQAAPGKVEMNSPLMTAEMNLLID